MKIISDVKNKTNSFRRVTVEIFEGEHLIAVKQDSFYKLGYPVEDIVGGHVLKEAVKVSWCSVEQKWIS